MNIAKIRENARKSLTGKWGKGALIIFSYIVIMVTIGMIESFFEEEKIITNIIVIVKTIITVPLSFGITYSFIKLKRNEEIKTLDFLSIGFSNFGRAWKLSLRMILKIILPIILMNVSIIVTFVALTYCTVQILTYNVSEMAVLVTLIGSILIIVMAVWCAIRMLLYALSTYISFDNPDMPALEVINESERLMKGNRFKLILLELSFIGWAVLSIFTLGIGYLWLIPYMQISGICFYEYLIEKNNEPIIEN